MFALANWQLQRGLDKAQRMQSIDSASNSASYSLETLLTRNQDIQDLPISFSGSINPQHVFYWITESNRGAQDLTSM
ncbi:hypothetical protein P4S73_22935 [Paraglaciecola sp. Hal342]